MTHCSYIMLRKQYRLRQQTTFTGWCSESSILRELLSFQGIAFRPAERREIMAKIKFRVSSLLPLLPATATATATAIVILHRLCVTPSLKISTSRQLQHNSSRPSSSFPCHGRGRCFYVFVCVCVSFPIVFGDRKYYMNPGAAQ